MNTRAKDVRADYGALVTGTASEELAAQRQVLERGDDYDSLFMGRVPEAVAAAEFGCGNPTRHLRAGDTVLDIGCGAGMNCYIAAQAVGATGRVIGADFTPAMLEIARGNREAFAAQVPDAAPMDYVLASANDLTLDLEWANGWLADNPVRSTAEMDAYMNAVAEARRTRPAVADASVDIVISNCVINLLDDTAKVDVFKEMFRVLKPGGRFAISDNVSNRPVPEELKADTVLWSACYAGVLQEQAFYDALEAAGFVNIRVEMRNPEPAKVVDDLLFYAVTVVGEKAEAPAFRGALPKVLYRGPNKAIIGDSGKVYRRGRVEPLAPQDRHMADDAEGFGLFVLDESEVTIEAQQVAQACCD
ncbi:MAG: methyltransferase domain-containing protein [Azospirillaceae bacterium]